MPTTPAATPCGPSRRPATPPWCSTTSAKAPRAIAEDVLQVPLIVANLADRPAVDQLLRDHAIEAVLHFAAFTYVGESVSDPSRY